MHELGIVFHIIRTVEDACRDNAILRVSSVTLQLGEVSGVVPHYLEDAWRWASNKNSLVAGAELKVEEIPAVTYCEDCKKTYETVKHGKTCPYCGSARTYLVQGQEVMVKEQVAGGQKCSFRPSILVAFFFSLRKWNCPGSQLSSIFSGKEDYGRGKRPATCFAGHGGSTASKEG